MHIDKKCCCCFIQTFIATVALLIAIYFLYINISFSWFSMSKTVKASGVTISSISIDDNNTTFIEMYEYIDSTATYELLETPNASFGPVQYYVWEHNNEPYYFVYPEDKVEKKYKITITQILLSDINYIDIAPTLITPQGIETLLLGYSTTETGTVTMVDFSTLSGNITIIPDSVRTITDTEILSKYGTDLISVVQTDIYIYISTSVDLDVDAVGAYMSANGYTSLDTVTITNSLSVVLFAY